MQSGRRSVSAGLPGLILSIVKILNGGAVAEYVFEPVYTEEAVPAELDFDEFVASMRLKGICCGLPEEVCARPYEADPREIARMLPQNVQQEIVA